MKQYSLCLRTKTEGSNYNIAPTSPQHQDSPKITCERSRFQLKAAPESNANHSAKLFIGKFPWKKTHSNFWVEEKSSDFIQILQNSSLPNIPFVQVTVRSSSSKPAKQSGMLWWSGWSRGWDGEMTQVGKVKDRFFSLRIPYSKDLVSSSYPDTTKQKPPWSSIQ